MKRKFLEDLGLEKEVIDKILDENSTDIGKAKGEVETLTSERDQLKADIRDRDKQLEDVKKSAGSNEELKAQIETLQAENKTKLTEYEDKIKQMQLETAMKEEFTSAGIVGDLKVKMVKALIDLGENPEVVEGKVKGLGDQLKKLQAAEETKGLFGTASKKKGFEPDNADNSTPTGVTKEQFAKMGYSDRVKLYNDNKELYDALSTN